MDLLENAKDFPKDGPILLITDGQIEERIEIQRKHASLLSQGVGSLFRQGFLYSILHFRRKSKSHLEDNKPLQNFKISVGAYYAFEPFFRGFDLKVYFA